MPTIENEAKEKQDSAKVAAAKPISDSLNLYSDKNFCPPQKPDDPNDLLALDNYRKNSITCANHLMREVRVEAQEVIRILDEHIAGNLNIENHLDELDSSKDDIDARIIDLQHNYINHILPKDLYSEIFNLWQMAHGNPYLNLEKRSEFLNKANGPDLLREINILRNRLSRLTYLIEYNTGIERINKWIEGARTGYALPFHSIFEDEMNSPEDRQKILNLYALQPKYIRNGLIDPVKGVILCYPPKRAERITRHVTVAIIFLLSFALINYLQPQLVALAGHSENPIKDPLVMCWGALLLGLAGHILVTGAKVSNAEFRQFPLPFNDWSYYFSARSTMMLYKLALSAFVFLSMFVMLKGELGLMEAFLIGYSFDSVVELVGVSLEKRSTGAVTAIKGRLDITAK